MTKVTQAKPAEQFNSMARRRRRRLTRQPVLSASAYMRRTWF